MSRLPFSVPFSMVEVSFHKAFSRRGAGKIGGTPQKCEKPYCPISGPYPVGIGIVPLYRSVLDLREPSGAAALPAMAEHAGEDCRPRPEGGEQNEERDTEIPRTVIGNAVQLHKQ